MIKGLITSAIVGAILAVAVVIWITETVTITIPIGTP